MPNDIGKHLVLIVGFVVLAYLNSFQGVFQFDDFNVIVNSPGVHSWGAWIAGGVKSIRPVLKFSYMLNWIAGPGTFGFHLFNLACHVSNALLVYWLTFTVAVRYPETVDESACKPAALTAALLFALHPVQTEAVSYISGRSASLMTLFYLASLLAYIRSEKPGRPIGTYLLSPVLFVLAVLTKETAITLPVAMLLWDKTIEKRSWKIIAKRQAVHWLLLAGMILFIGLHPSYRRLLLFAVQSRPLSENLLSQANGFMYLISRFISLNNLNIDPDLPVLAYVTPLVAVQLCSILGLLITALCAYRRSPWVAFGILWFFLHLLPTNSIVPRLDIVNERHLYLPTAGISVLVGIELGRFMVRVEKYRNALMAGIGCGVAVLCYFTALRNHDYRSEIALWEDTVRKSPAKARAFNNLGVAYEEAGYSEKAARAYSRALDLNPGNEKARYNMQRDNLRRSYLELKE